MILEALPYFLAFSGFTLFGVLLGAAIQETRHEKAPPQRLRGR